MPHPAAPSPRLAFLDTLRAVAALAVLLAHMLSEIWPGFQQFRFAWFDLGSFGVTIFFLASGFIIQPSIEQAPSLRSFWRRRLYRLYPIYWFSVLASAAVAALGLARPSVLLAVATPYTVLANLTMLQTMLGAPHLQVVYWSLAYELIFYLLASLFSAVRLSAHSAAITIGLIGATLIVEVLAPLLGGPRMPLTICGFLVIMFSGVLFQRAAQGRLAAGAALAISLAGLATIVASALADSLLRSGGWWQNRYLISAWAAAYAVFMAAYAMRGRRLLSLPPLLFIGRASYSLYVLHLLVILTIPPVGGALGSLALWSGASIGLAALTYAAIERPLIARARAADPPQGRGAGSAAV
jgi:peptidoglycan/LPS O-acetylase OafA/YrhL